METFPRNKVEDALYEAYEGSDKLAIDKRVFNFMSAVCKESNSPNNKWMKSEVSEEAIIKTSNQLLSKITRYNFYNILGVFEFANRYTTNNEPPCKMLNRWVEYLSNDGDLSNVFNELEVNNISELFGKLSLLIDKYYTEKEFKSNLLNLEEKDGLYKHKRIEELCDTNVDTKPYIVETSYDNNSIAIKFKCPICKKYSDVQFTKEDFSYDMNSIFLKCPKCGRSITITDIKDFSSKPI